jgi:hypothetical protein
MSFLKSLWGVIFALLLVAWRCIEIILFGIWQIIIFIGTLIRFVWMFIFLIIGVIAKCACFGFMQGWNIALKVEGDEAQKNK